MSRSYSTNRHLGKFTFPGDNNKMIITLALKPKKRHLRAVSLSITAVYSDNDDAQERLVETDNHAEDGHVSS